MADWKKIVLATGTSTQYIKGDGSFATYSTGLPLTGGTVTGDVTFNGNVKILDTSAPNLRLNPDTSDATDADRAFIGYATGNDNFITGTVDNDLAIRSSATGNIVFGRGTTESARLDSSGNAIFGGDITSDGNLKLRSGSGRNIYFTESDGTVDEMSIGYDQANQRLRFRSNAHSADRMVITKSGNVGIGLDNPSKPLHIYSSNNAPLRVQSTDAYSGIEFRDNTSSSLPPIISALADDFIIYGGNASLRPTILTLTSSNQRATFAGDVRLGISKKIYGQSNSTNSIEFYNGSTGAMNFVSGTATYDYPMEFRQNDRQVMTIKSQRVGIGTQSPAQGQSTPISDIKLDVAGNQMLSDLSTTNTDQSKLFFFRSDGAVGSQGQVPSGLKIGAIEWTALTNADDNNSISSARIEAEASNVWDSASNRNADLIFSTVGSNTLTEAMRIDSSQNTTFANDVIVGGDISGGSDGHNIQFNASGSQLYFLQLTRSTTSLTTVGNIEVGGRIEKTGELYINPTTNLRLRGNVITFGNAGGTSEYARFDSSGRLGIGTTSPSDTLHLKASVPVIRLTDSDTGDYHRIYGSNGGLYFDADKGVSGGTATSVIGFGVDDSRVMTLASGGNVGIGTTSPKAKLHVAGGTASHGDGVYYYENVAFKNGGASETGTLKITLPMYNSTTMLKFTIEGYDYSGGARGKSWTVETGGYIYNNNDWYHYYAHIRGRAPFDSVRLSHDGSKNVILLGTTSTTWGYPKIVITEVLAGFNNTDDWGSGYSMSWITSETGIGSNIYTPNIDYRMASNGDSIFSVVKTQDSSDTADYVKMYHDGSDGYLISNRGQLRLSSQNGIDALKIDSSGNVSLTNNLSLTNGSPVMYMSGSGGDHTRFGWTEGDPDVAYWRFYQNGGMTASITMDAFTENTAGGRIEFNSGASEASIASIDSGGVFLGKDAVGQNTTTELGGYGVLHSDGSRYGNYGWLTFNAPTNNYTGGSRGWAITNAYLGTNFAILKSNSASGEPYLSTGGVAGTGTTAPFRIDANGSTTFGGGVSMPSGNLSVGGKLNVASSVGIGSVGLEKTFSIAFAHGVSNQKAQIQFTKFWGELEISVSGTYSNQNNAGVITKKYGLGVQSDATYANESRYTESLGVTADNFAIGEVTWDSTNSRYYIPIVHRVATGNTCTVRVRCLGGDGSMADYIEGLTVGSVYTTDTTTYDKPEVSFISPIGIGTSSPDGTLHIHTATAGTVTADTWVDDLVVENSGDGGISIITPSANQGAIAFGDPDDANRGQITYQHYADKMTFKTNAVVGMTMDSSQNVTFAGIVGIEVTPETDWRSSNVTALQVGAGGSIFGRKDAGETKIFIAENVKWTSDGFEYINNGSAGYHQLDGGTHTFAVAGSGSADTVASFTTALKINNDGSVGIGTTSPDGSLHINKNTDGVTGALIISNDQASASGSKNEAVQMLFGLSGENDSGVIRVGKDEDYTSVGATSSFMSFYTKADGTTSEVMRFRKHIGLGIKTTNPNATLHLQDENDTEIRFSFANGQYMNKLRNEWSAGTASASKMRFHISDGTTTGFNEVLTLTGNQRVGIGTNSPSQKLELGGSTSGQTLCFSNTGVNTTNGARVQANIRYKTGSYSGQNTIQIITETQYDDSSAVVFNTGASSAERMRINYQGNIGIGTTSPAKLLHIESSTNADLLLKSTGASEDARLFIHRNDNNGRAYLKFEDLDNSYNWFTGLLRSSGNNYAIGTGDDFGTSTFLSISGSGNTTLGGNLTIPAGNIIYLDGGSNTYIYQETADKISFVTNNSVRLSLANTLATFETDLSIDGRIGIGTQSPSYPGLHISNSTPYLALQDSDGTNQKIEILHSGATTYFTGRNGGSYGSFVFRGYNGSVYSTAVTIDSSQRVGIQEVSPTEALHVKGNIKASGELIGKTYVTFVHNFTDDMGTSAHTIPWTDGNEAPNNSKSNTNFVAPYPMSLVKIIIRPKAIQNSGTIRVVLKKEDDGDSTNDTVATATPSGNLASNTAKVVTASDFNVAPDVGILDKINIELSTSVDVNTSMTDWFVTTVWTMDVN